VLFLFQAWRYNLVITNSQFIARPVVYTLYRKPFNDNIYKQWELGQVMVLRLVTDFGELVKVALKSGVVGKGVCQLGKRYGGFCVL
jgi:hypothetical protein